MRDRPEVVIVDDDSELLAALRDQVQAMGYPAAAFAEPQPALDHVSTSAGGVCLLLDLRMPDMDGLELQARLDALAMPVAIVFLSGQPGIPETVRAIKAGAVDFLEKPVEHAALEDALRRASEKLATEIEKHRGEVEAREKLSRLTDRERDVFEELARLEPSKVIAHRLGISEHTVTTHRASIMRKLTATSVQDLVAIARDLQLI